MTQMTPDLYKAILAMDSYNRGYGASIDLRIKNSQGNYITDSDTIYVDSTGTHNAKIGNATVSVTKGQLDAQAIGFYGIAYTLGSEKIIAYRGTDFPTGDSTLGIGSDILNGYGTGLGHESTLQSDMAIGFYKDVAGIGTDPRLANISLTGHSLGGGLAGYVGSLYGKTGVLFDNMAFEDAADLEYTMARLDILPSGAKGVVYGSSTPWANSISGLHAYNVTGQFLGINTFLQDTITLPLDIGPNVNLGFAYDGIKAHSMATLSILLYADITAGGVTDWKAAAKYFWPVMYDNSFANSIGMSTVAGKAKDDDDYSGILRQVIAYSVIDEGTKIYGDTGIRAFYDDANDLGKAVSLAGGSTLLAAHGADISKAFVQFAGQLALNKIEQVASAAVLNGVITYVNDWSDHSLTVDFSKGVWDRAGVAPVGSLAPAYNLVTSIIGTHITDLALRDAMKYVWGNDQSDVFERVVFATQETGSSSLTVAASVGHSNLFIGGNGDNEVTGSDGHDLIIGGDGIDNLYGGNGNDIFIGGAGNNIIHGGAGFDAVVYADEVIGVTIVGNTVTRFGATDTVYNVEHVVLTNGDDTITQTMGSQSTLWDGGTGTDVFNANTVGAYDMAKHKTYSGDFQYEQALKNFETINLTTSYLIPDENVDITSTNTGVISLNGTINFAGSKTADYSGAQHNATFYLSSYALDTISINGHTHGLDINDFSVVGTTIGTNYGDIVHINARQNSNRAMPSMRFISGMGDDMVYCDSGNAKGLEYVYTGGRDVIGVQGGGLCLSAIRLAAYISFSDVTFNYDALAYRLILTIQNHGSLTINNYIAGGADELVNRIYFGGNSYLTGPYADYLGVYHGTPYSSFSGSYFSGGIENDILEGNDQANYLYGGIGDDTLNGGKGDDILSGGSGHDTYIYDLGDGNDSITELGTENIGDAIQFGAGISLADVSFFKPLDVNSMIPLRTQLDINIASGGKISIANQYPDPNANDTSAPVEILILADGTKINLLGGLPFAGTSGADTVFGTAFDDSLTGRAGDDTLYGDTGNDTYIFNVGDGQDYIFDDNGTDTIKFGASITLGDIWFDNQSAGYSSLVIHYGVSDQLTINNQLYLDSETGAEVIQYKVEQILFADGSTFDISKGLPFVGTSDNDHISGTEYADILTGMAGNDYLYGGNGDDIIDGGAGDDTINGGPGIDTVSHLSAALGVTVSLNTGGYSGQNTVGVGIDIIWDCENLTGSNFNDILEGNGINNIINGAAGDDIIKGMLGVSHTYIGGSGTDTLSYASSDTYAPVSINLSLAASQSSGSGTTLTLSGIENLVGSAYNDTLIGDANANIIEGRGGNDNLNGGLGIDTVSYASAATGVTVNLAITSSQNTVGAGTDTISGFESLIGSAFNDILTGDANANTIEGGLGNDTLNGGLGVDTASYVSAGAAVTVSLATTAAQNTLGAGTDTLSGIENLIGSAFNDTLTGDDNANTLEGGLGNDALTGGLGIDAVSYASAAAAVTVNLTTTTAQNTIGAGTDTLSGFENLIGSDFNDVLAGSSVGNILYGGLGNDSLDGGLANDTLYGGAGNDKYIYSSGSGKGNDIIEDESGAADQVAFGAAYTAANTSLVRVGQYDLALVSGGQNLFYIKNQFTLDGSIESIKWGDGSILNLLTYNHPLNGTAAGETLYGTSYGAAVGDVINALGGADTVYAGDGNDVVSGGDDGDFLYGENGNDLLNGNLGNDTLNGGAGSDTASYVDAASFVAVNLSVVTAQNTLGSGVDTLIDIENITGSLFDDVLIGSDAANTIDGMDGNDMIKGGLGDDTLIGGVGTDTLTYAGSATSIAVNLATLTAQDTLGAGIDTLSGFENLIGSAFNDTLTGDANANTIEGCLGNDTLNGGLGVDTVSYASASALVKVNLATLTAQNSSGAGTDTLSAFENILGSIYNDTLTGNTGANTIDGGSGNDVIQGGLGDDSLIGGLGTDTVTYAAASAAIALNLATLTAQNTGGAGTDTLSGFEYIIGSAYNDTLIGNSSSNKIEGGLGNDTLDGGTGTDTVSYASASSAVTVNLATTIAQNTGGAGTDLLANFESIYGSAFGDTLTGNASANTLTGAAGADTITGGLGADAFKFVLGTMDGTSDHITDYSTAQGDKIDLRDLLVGYDPLTKLITDFVEFTNSGANTIMKVDRDGVGTAYGWQQIGFLDNVTGLTDEAALKASGNLIVI